ncbi:hypothetical protein QVD99_008490 [Batrachochytrium dendrobatidis]|nr:hypothetical protein QVD99_008490 [Batrachochytrium dendrobatidis]
MTPSIPPYLLPDYDPCKATINELCSVLSTMNVALPASRQLKQVYIDLFNKTVTADTRPLLVDRVLSVRPSEVGITQLSKDGICERLLATDIPPPSVAVRTPAREDEQLLEPFELSPLPLKHKNKRSITTTTPTTVNQTAFKQTVTFDKENTRPLHDSTLSDDHRQVSSEVSCNNTKSTNKLAAAVHSASTLLRKISIPRRRGHLSSSTDVDATQVDLKQVHTQDASIPTAAETTSPVQYKRTRIVLGHTTEEDPANNDHTDTPTTPVKSSRRITRTTVVGGTSPVAAGGLTSTDHDLTKLKSNGSTTKSPSKSLGSDTEISARSTSLQHTSTKLRVFSNRTTPSRLYASSNIQIHDMMDCNTANLDNDSRTVSTTNVFETGDMEQDINTPLKYRQSTTQGTHGTKSVKATQSPKSKNANSNNDHLEKSPNSTMSAPSRSKFYIDPFMPGVRSKVGGAAHSQFLSHSNQSSLFSPDAVTQNAEDDQVEFKTRKVSDLAAEWTRKIQMSVEEAKAAAAVTTSLAAAHNRGANNMLAASAEPPIVEASSKLLYPDLTNRASNDLVQTNDAAHLDSKKSLPIKKNPFQKHSKSTFEQSSSRKSRNPFKSVDADEDCTVTEMDDSVSEWSQADGGINDSSHLASEVYDESTLIAKSSWVAPFFGVLFVAAMTILVGLYWRELVVLAKTPFDEKHPIMLAYAYALNMYANPQIAMDHIYEFLEQSHHAISEWSRISYLHAVYAYALLRQYMLELMDTVLTSYGHVRPIFISYAHTTSASVFAVYADLQKTVLAHYTSSKETLVPNLLIIWQIIVDRQIAFVHECATYCMTIYTSMSMTLVRNTIDAIMSAVDAAAHRVAEWSQPILDPLMAKVHVFLKSTETGA